MTLGTIEKKSCLFLQKFHELVGLQERDRGLGREKEKIINSKASECEID